MTDGAWGRLPAGVRWRVLARSLLLQASWNFERLQSLGFLYVVAPALRFFYQGEELAAACRRHLEHFSTHPFMASPVLGTVLALEECGRRGEYSPLEIQDFKRMVMAPFAAMGDALFWGGLRPACAGVALLFALRGSFWAPVIFLLLFNGPHLSFRFMGLLAGYNQGVRIVEVIQRRRLPDLALRLKEGTVILLGGICAWLTWFSLGAEQLSPEWGVVAVPVVFLLSRLVHRGLSPLLLILGVSALVLLAEATF